jgi:hypothetical protein
MEKLFVRRVGCGERKNKTCKLVYFDQDVFRDIRRYCVGPFGGIVNALVRLGLKKLMEEQKGKK